MTIPVNEADIRVFGEEITEPLENDLLNYMKERRERRLGDIFSDFTNYDEYSIKVALGALRGRKLVKCPIQLQRRSLVIYAGPRELSDDSRNQIEGVLSYIKSRGQTNLNQLQEVFQYIASELPDILCVLREGRSIVYNTGKSNSLRKNTRIRYTGPVDETVPCFSFPYSISEERDSIEIGIDSQCTPEQLAEEILRIMRTYKMEIDYEIFVLRSVPYISVYNRNEAVLEMRLRRTNNHIQITPRDGLYSKEWTKLLVELGQGRIT